MSEALPAKLVITVEWERTRHGPAVAASCFTKGHRHVYTRLLDERAIRLGYIPRAKAFELAEGAVITSLHHHLIDTDFR